MDILIRNDISFRKDWRGRGVINKPNALQLSSCNNYKNKTNENVVFLDLKSTKYDVFWKSHC